MRPLIRTPSYHQSEAQPPKRPAYRSGQPQYPIYVRDDKPFGGPAPPAAVFYYSRDRAGEHPQAHLANYSGIFQADAYSGYGKLYEPGRSPGPIFEAACWVHARRPFFVMADLAENARRNAQGKKPAVISPLGRKDLGEFDALVLGLFLMSHFKGQVVVPDFGFYGRDAHVSLIREGRLIAGVNTLVELPPLLRRQVLMIEDKIASGTTVEDAETLAAYARLQRGTNGFNEFVQDAIA